VLPPKESWSNLVNFESLYGICCDFPSTKALITFPKALNDKLIFWAYLSLSPAAPVLLNLSLPAKSTKFNLLATYFLSSLYEISADSKNNINIKCDLEESLFIAVYPTVLFLLP